MLKKTRYNNLKILSLSNNKLLIIIISIIVSVIVHFIEKKVWIPSHSELAKINICFTPPSGCRELIIEAINNAKQQILVQGYSFTSKTILEALKEAAYRNVEVKIILDKSQEAGQYSIYKTVKPFKNFDIIIGNHTRGIAHNKVMIIDDELVITGSYNWTDGAEFRNAENVLLIHDKTTAQIFKENFMRYINAK